MPLEVVQGAGNNTLVLQIRRSPQGRDVAVVYVNEPPGTGTVADGRKIMVRLPRPPAAGVPAAPGGAVALAVPQGNWTFQPHATNILHNRIGQSFQARFQGAGGAVEVRPGAIHRVNGAPAIAFTASACGLDKYDVSVRRPGRGGDVTEQVTVLVMKRIRYHYIEMLKGANAAQGVYSLTNFAGQDVLGDAERHWRTNYGIHLERIDTLQQPHHNFLTGAAQLGNYAAPAAQRNAAANRRVLWVIAADRVRLTAGPQPDAGLAISHVASVSCRSFEQDLATYQVIERSWQAYRQWARRTGTLETEPGWLRWMSTPDGGNNPQQVVQQNRNLYLAVKTHGARTLASRQLLSTVLHEIGHTFGLVPTAGTAAGQAQAAWNDSGPQGNRPYHCSDQNCLMWWQVEETGGLSWMRGASADLNFCRRTTDQGSYTGRCSLFMIAGDLSNLSNLPA